MNVADRIAVDWRTLPSQERLASHERLASPEGLPGHESSAADHEPSVRVVTPKLSVRFEHASAVGLCEAALAPMARYTVVPYVVANDLGVAVTALTPVRDPVLPQMDLWLWEGSQPVRVIGRDLDRCLAMRLQVAFATCHGFETVLLGARFFHNVRLCLDPLGESTIETIRRLP